MGVCSAALYQSVVEDTSSLVDFCGPLSESVRFKQIACDLLRTSFYKKFVDSTAGDADEKAFNLFNSHNQRCAEWLPDAEFVRTELYGELKNSLYNFWYKDGYSMVHSFSDIFYRSRFGSGSTRLCGVATTYNKLFASPLTCSSSELYTLYSNIIEGCPIWRDAEITRRSLYGPVRYVDGNRLSFVPKTESISRVIATEPTLNSFVQLGFGQLLLDRLKEVFNIDLSIQPDHNREMARIGSLNDWFSTIDLSSASDTISINMLARILPKPFLDWLKLFRSPVYEKDGELHTLNMISSMGNGFTFPLQTIIFTCVVSAVYRVLGIPLIRASSNLHGNFGVFGDDIVIRKPAYDLTVYCLEHLGFTVNTDKSFNKGLFRESCGHDYYQGHNVRGVYIKSLRSREDSFKAINRLNDWTSRTGIPLTKTISYLLSNTPRLFVPLCENEDAGIRCPDVLITERRFDRNDGSRRYKRHVPRASRLLVHDGYILAPKGRKIGFNRFGLSLCFLGGFIRNHKIMIRLDHVSYETKWAKTPFWDFDPPVHPYRWFRTVSFRSACLINMQI